MKSVRIDRKFSEVIMNHDFVNLRRVQILGLSLKDRVTV